MARTKEEERAAIRWGKALTAEMERAGIGVLEMARRTGWQKATISDYRRGVTLPLLQRAEAIADLLCAPHLLSLCVTLRTVKCDECERTFVRNKRGGNQQRWCSDACHDRFTHRVTWANERRWTGKRYDTWKRKHDRLRNAVDAMCNSCEPDGVCRQADCPLRKESPFPLLAARTGTA